MSDDDKPHNNVCLIQHGKLENFFYIVLLLYTTYILSKSPYPNYYVPIA